MKNYRQDGQRASWTAPTGGVVGGNGYLIGALFVVAGQTVAAGLPFNGEVKGIFNLTKNPTEAWTEGQILYWDNTNFRVTSVSTSNTKIGCCAALGGVAANTATGDVALNGIV